MLCYNIMYYHTKYVSENACLNLMVMETNDVSGTHLEFLPTERRNLTDLRPQKDMGWAYE